MSETVVLDFELKSPIDRVWNALTNPETLSKWMLFKANDFQPVVGHTFQFRDAEGWDGFVDCEVTEVEKPNRLSYTWVGGGGDNAPFPTVVSWTLTEGEAGVTNLHLEQSGFQTGAKQEIGGARYGWMSMLDKLQALLA
ncbi:MAG: SRPBCC domain-containing protein [Thermomicrobiales bacterium]